MKARVAQAKGKATEQECASLDAALVALLSLASPAGWAKRADSSYMIPAHIALIDEAIVELCEGESELKGLIVTVPPRHGKQCKVTEDILTADGWRTIGSLEVGDLVFTPGGAPTSVIAKSTVDPDAPKFTVTMSDGTSVQVHPCHEWTVRTRIEGAPAWATYETQEMRTLGCWTGERGCRGSRAMFQLPFRGVLEFPEAELPIEPYLFGIWLGDGRSAGGDFCAGVQDASATLAQVVSAGASVSGHTIHGTTGVHYYSIEGLYRRLGELGVRGAKRIPESYLCASVTQRRALLQGLVDSDGSLDCQGRVRYVGHDSALVEDVALLARTLGHEPTIHSQVDTRDPHELNGHMVKTAGTRWVCNWTPNDGLPPGRLERKAKVRKPTCRRRVAIVSIEPAPSADGMCIQVASADGLFLVGKGLIPTHNSELCSKHTPAWFLSRWPDKKVILASYEADFAASWGAKARDLILENPWCGVLVKSLARAAKRWELQGYKGGMFTAGVGGPVTGKGAHLLIIDDPVKNAEEAKSKVMRDKAWDWFTSTAYTRLEPGGKVLVIMCLAGDSIVPTTRGPVAIRDIRAGDHVYGFDASMEPKAVLAQRLSGTSPTVIVRTGSAELTATGTHPFLVTPARRPFAPEWREAGTLTPGDVVVMHGGLPGDGTSPVPGWDTCERTWLLGYMFGDGWVTSWERRNKYKDSIYHSRSWAICVALTSDEGTNQKVRGRLVEAFGREPRRCEGPRYWRLDHASAGRELEALGLTAGVGAKAKRIPSWVFVLPSQPRLAFLEGLLAADGYKDKRSLGYVFTSSSEGLVKDVRNLVRSLGGSTGHVRTYGARWAQAPNSPKPTLSQSWSLYVVLPDDVRNGGSLIKGNIPYGVRLERITDVVPGPVVEVYDLSVEAPANFAAEGFIVHNTRWHEDDLVGRLLEQEADEWDVINLPALAEGNDDLGRPDGAPLWPERYDAEALARIRSTVGPEVFGALYQQHPTTPEGGLFRESALRFYDTEDDGIHLGDKVFTAKSLTRFITCDLAVTVKTRSDYTVYSVWGVTKEKQAQLVLLDVYRHRLEGPDHLPALKTVMKRWDPQWVGVESATYGINLLQAGRRDGLIMRSLIADKDKVARAMQAAALNEQGRLWLPRNHKHTATIVDELITFDKGVHDDFVDTLAYAAREMLKRKSWAGPQPKAVPATMEEKIWASFRAKQKGERNHPILGKR